MRVINRNVTVVLMCSGNSSSVLEPCRQFFFKCLKCIFRTQPKRHFRTTINCPFVKLLCSSDLLLVMSPETRSHRISLQSTANSITWALSMRCREEMPFDIDIVFRFESTELEEFFSIFIL